MDERDRWPTAVSTAGSWVAAGAGVMAVYFGAYVIAAFFGVGAGVILLWGRWPAIQRWMASRRENPETPTVPAVTEKESDPVKETQWWLSRPPPTHPNKQWIYSVPDAEPMDRWKIDIPGLISEGKATLDPPLTIVMLCDHTGSPDGHTVLLYREDTEHTFKTVDELDLGKVFLREGWAKEKERAS